MTLLTVVVKPRIELREQREYPDSGLDDGD